MIPAGNEIGRATDRIVGMKKGTKLIRVHLGGAFYYFACGRDENPAEAIPLLRGRKGTKAEQIAVIGPNGYVRPNSTQEIPVAS